MKYLIAMLLALFPGFALADDSFIPLDLGFVELFPNSKPSQSFRIPSNNFKIILCDNRTPLTAYAGGGRGQLFLQDTLNGDIVTVRYDSRSYNEDALPGGIDVLKLFTTTPNEEGGFEDMVDVFTADMEGCDEYIAGIPPPP